MKKKCEHVWERTSLVCDSNPPKDEYVCKKCGERDYVVMRKYRRSREKL